MRVSSRRLRILLGDYPSLCGFAILAIVLLVAIGADFLTGDQPFDIVGTPNEPPFGDFLLGTDTLGRSIASGIAHGSRVALAIGTITALISMTFGILMGGLAGYFGGRVDDVLMRITEFFQTIPAMLLAIVIVAILQPSIMTEVVAITAVSWAPLARLVRSEFLALRNREYVQACVAMGMSDVRIMITQILPNAASSIIVAGSITIATSILLEAGLSFLGLGDPNVMSWGLMVGSGRTALRSAWWVSGLPGFAVLFTVLAINLVSDGLNLALNPRTDAGK